MGTSPWNQHPCSKVPVLCFTARTTLKEQTVEIYSILISSGKSWPSLAFSTEKLIVLLSLQSGRGMCLGLVQCGYKTSQPWKEHPLPGSVDIETLITFIVELSSTMSEEVTYATLTFQDSVAAGNNRDRNNLRKRGRSSEKARCDFRGWAAVKCLEVLALRRMLKRGVLWNLQNGDQVGESSNRVTLRKKYMASGTF